MKKKIIKYVSGIILIIALLALPFLPILDKTGGIVQGMSGSPIIQDNKIVGAVTHVFVNDPTSGYGIHIEWMLEATDINYKESFAKAG